MQFDAGRWPAADIAMQPLIVQEGSHLGSVISSQWLQREARRLDHLGRGPFRLDQHRPTLSLTFAGRPTAGSRCQRAAHAQLSLCQGSPADHDHLLQSPELSEGQLVVEGCARLRMIQIL